MGAVRAAGVGHTLEPVKHFFMERALEWRGRGGGGVGSGR